MVGISIAAGVIGVGAWVVWGYVVLRLAELGIKYPSHKGFLIELAKSKKMEMPTVTLGKMSTLERKEHNDNTTK